MKRKYLKIFYTCMAICGLIAVACDQDPLKVYTAKEGSYPVISTLYTTINSSYPRGAEVKFQIAYWSNNPIQDIKLRSINALTRTALGTPAVTTRDTTLVATVPYQPSFSPTKRLDTLIMTYVVPATLPIGTANGVTTAATVTLMVEVNNKNGLSRSVNLTPVISVQ